MDSVQTISDAPALARFAVDHKRTFLVYGGRTKILIHELGKPDEPGALETIAADGGRPFYAFGIGEGDKWDSLVLPAAFDNIARGLQVAGQAGLMIREAVEKAEIASLERLAGLPDTREGSHAGSRRC
jgi:hypothetical protein